MICQETYPPRYNYLGEKSSDLLLYGFSFLEHLFADVGENSALAVASAGPKDIGICRSLENSMVAYDKLEIFRPGIDEGGPLSLENDVTAVLRYVPVGLGSVG